MILSACWIISESSPSKYTISLNSQQLLKDYINLQYFSHSLEANYEYHQKVTDILMVQMIKFAVPWLLNSLNPNNFGTKSTSKMSPHAVNILNANKFLNAIFIHYLSAPPHSLCLHWQGATKFSCGEQVSPGSHVPPTIMLFASQRLNLGLQQVEAPAVKQDPPIWESSQAFWTALEIRRVGAAGDA